MKKQSWLMALMMGAVALSAAACNDDTSNSDTNTNTGVHNYTMTCSHGGCTVELYALDDIGDCVQNRACRATVGITLMDQQNATQSVAVNGVSVSVAQMGSGFSVTQADGSALGAGAQIVTDSNGQINLSVAALTPGNGYLTFTLPAEYGGKSINFNIKVIQPDVVNVYDILANASYMGERTLERGFATLIANKTCAELIANKPEEEVTNLDVNRISMGGRTQMMTFTNRVGSSTFEGVVESSDKYAVFVSSNDYTIWGCDDNLDASKKVASVMMKDALIDGIVDPGETKANYYGKYTLTSSFNALSLLPHAAKTDPSETVLFANMLVGDWVDFALDFLANPTAGLSNVLLHQLLPLLLNSEWLQAFAAKFNINLDADTINALITTFQADKALENVLNGFVQNLGDWYSSTTSVVSIVRDFATQFTLNGALLVNSPELDETSSLPNVIHTYDSVLINVGQWANVCQVIGGSPYGKTVDNSGNICKIGLTSLDSGGVLQGKISKIVIDEENGLASIQPHSVNIAYGKLILGVLLKVLPVFVTDMGMNPPQTLGGVLEYFIGKGAAAYWNNREAKRCEDAIANGEESCTPDNVDPNGGCSTIGSVLAKAINISIGSTLVASVCTTGVNALDGVINGQLDRLATSGDIIRFSSDNCMLYYTNNKAQLASFGYVSDEAKWWGSSLDLRCDWNLKIGESATCVSEGEEVDKNCIKGKFFAINQNKQ